MIRLQNCESELFYSDNVNTNQQFLMALPELFQEPSRVYYESLDEVQHQQLKDNYNVSVQSRTKNSFGINKCINIDDSSLSILLVIMYKVEPDPEKTKFVINRCTVILQNTYYDTLIPDLTESFISWFESSQCFYNSWQEAFSKTNFQTLDASIKNQSTNNYQLNLQKIKQFQQDLLNAPLFNQNEIQEDNSKDFRQSLKINLKNNHAEFIVNYRKQSAPSDKLFQQIVFERFLTSVNQHWSILKSVFFYGGLQKTYHARNDELPSISHNLLCIGYNDSFKLMDNLISFTFEKNTSFAQLSNIHFYSCIAEALQWPINIKIDEKTPHYLYSKDIERSLEQTYPNINNLFDRLYIFYCQSKHCIPKNIEHMRNDGTIDDEVVALIKMNDRHCNAIFNYLKTAYSVYCSIFDHLSLLIHLKPDDNIYELLFNDLLKEHYSLLQDFSCYLLPESE